MTTYGPGRWSDRLYAYGTSGADYIDTNEAYNLYPQYTSFQVEGGDGNDNLVSRIWNRSDSGFDVLLGQAGNDNMFCSAVGAQYAEVFAGGGYGLDTISSVMNLGSNPTFVKNYSTILEVDLYPIDGGSRLHLDVSDSTEIIVLKVNGVERAWLTEDLFVNTRAPSMTVAEAFSRATTDWSYYGLPSSTTSSTNTTDDSSSTTASSNANTFEEGGVYRLYNSSSGKHLFSSNQTEIDQITGQGWVNEGMSYKTPSNASASLHRFFVLGENRHFYTANDSEKDLILANPNMQNFSYEGIAFNVYSAAEAPSGSLSVVRYFNNNTGSHLYSTNSTEQGILNSSADWTNEGIAWYGDTA